MENKTSIILVTWNSKAHIKKCLDSIQKHTSHNETIIIDNASKDGTDVFLKNYCKSNKNFSAIFNSENRGFAAANNQAMSISHGDFILLLNPDTEIFSHTIPALVHCLETNNNAGIVGAKHFDKNMKLQPSVRKLPTLLSQLCILLKIHRIFPKLGLIKKYFSSDFDYSKTQPVEQVAGSCFMIKKKAFEKIGPFDESFFLWFEEVDYCMRAKINNFLVLFCPDSELLHHGAQSFSQVLPLKKQIIFYHSMYRYFQKYGTKRDRVFLRIARDPSYFLSFIFTLLQGIKKFLFASKDRTNKVSMTL